MNHPVILAVAVLISAMILVIPAITGAQRARDSMFQLLLVVVLGGAGMGIAALIVTLVMQQPLLSGL